MKKLLLVASCIRATLISLMLEVREFIYWPMMQLFQRTGILAFAVNLPNGSTISLASTYGADKTLSALSNANPGVATLEASHGVIVGDILVVTSGWAKLNGRVARASVVATNDVSLEGMNTTSTTSYPSGSGTGTVKEVTAWQQITQILETNSSGGEQQFHTYSFLEDDNEHQIPTVKSPVAYKFKIADDATLAHYSVLDAADLGRLPQAVRLVLPSGSVLYWNAYITLSRIPTLTKNELMALEVTMSLVADPTRYTS